MKQQDKIKITKQEIDDIYEVTEEIPEEKPTENKEEESILTEEQEAHDTLLFEEIENQEDKT